MIVNLTPHPIRLYPPETPDRIEPAEHQPERVFQPAGRPARLAMIDLGTQYREGVPVELVEFGHAHDLPPYDKASSDRYIVALVVALANLPRSDLLVPYREVRNMDGTVVGCRLLAQPV